MAEPPDARGAPPQSPEAVNAINQRIFDTSVDLILVVDRRGTFLRVSPSATTILGYDPDEMIGHSATEILYQLDLDRTREEMRLARRGRLTRNFECRYVHKNGHIVTLWWTGVWSESEQQHFFIGRDVTERRRLERLERESAAHAALAVEISGIGLASADGPTEPARPNAQFNKIFGLPADKAEIGVGEWLRLIHPDDRDRMAAGVLAAIRQGGVYRGEFRIRRADTGEERWVRAATQTVRGPEEPRGRFLGVHLDITDLKENARLLEAAMEIARLGTWASDVTGASNTEAHLEMSAEAYRILGRTQDGFEDRIGAFWDLIHPGDRAEVMAARRSALQSGEPYTAQFRVIRPDGEIRWVQLRAGVIRDATGTPTKITGVIQDVTERNTVEQRLRQAQRMDAIGQLTGGMAHDFNNLLGIIIANLDMLRFEDGLNRGQDELAGEALEAALRGADLTRRLLAFARRQQLQPERIAVNDLVGGIVGLLSRTLGEQIPITVNLAEGLWPVQIDPAQLEASLINLATNARDAMPRGGKLLITTANRILDEEYAATHGELTAGDFVMIEVSDTGTGIPPDIMAQVFEPFFTTKEPGKGTGLGLSMVFGFANQSGGHINVYSEPGQGTTFRLYLPRDATADVAAAPVSPAALPTAGGNETILVVEDNEGVRRAVRRQLIQLGYQVVEASTATGALDVLAGEPIDLLLTDVVMPGEMDGIELAHTAVARWPELRVVLTSGFPESRLTGNGGPIAGLRLLSKPYRRDELARTLREILDQGQSGRT
jgi:PAS domain S-box-containing protein